MGGDLRLRDSFTGFFGGTIGGGFQVEREREVMADAIVQFARDADAFAELAAFAEEFAGGNEFGIDAGLIFAGFGFTFREGGGDHRKNLKADERAGGTPAPAHVVVRLEKTEEERGSGEDPGNCQAQREEKSDLPGDYYQQESDEVVLQQEGHAEDGDVSSSNAMRRLIAERGSAEELYQKAGPKIRKNASQESHWDCVSG